MVMLYNSRVGNMRHSTLVEAHVRAILISKRVTEEGEIMPYFQTELSVWNCLNNTVPQQYLLFRLEQTQKEKKMKYFLSGRPL